MFCVPPAAAAATTTKSCYLNWDCVFGGDNVNMFQWRLVAVNCFRMFFLQNKINKTLNELWQSFEPLSSTAKTWIHFGCINFILFFFWRWQNVTNECSQTNENLGREPWSSGYGRKLMFERLWFQIPAPNIRWTWHFFIDLL